MPSFWAALLSLMSFDLLIGSDKPLLWASGFFLFSILYARAWSLLPAALLIFWMFPASLFYPNWIWGVPAVSFLLPLLASWLFSFPIKEARNTFQWAKWGTYDQATLILLILTSLISALALILWALRTDYLGVASHMLGHLKTTPRWFSLLILVPGFALVNALAEEAVFRGVIQDALERCFPERQWLVAMLQASAFAAVHFQGGFPNGKLGYLMTFFYALMLGFLRRRSGGMLAPYVAHVLADVVIGFTLVLLSA